MEIKGSTMLKVVSILYIVFSGIGILFSFLIIAGGSMLSSTLADQYPDIMDSAMGSAIFAVIGVICLVVCAFNLIVGIVGVKNCKNPSGAKVCFVLGIIILSLSVLSIIGTIANGSFSAYNFGGIILPALYTYGAYQVKSNA